jgi:hypothetical protein
MKSITLNLLVEDQDGNLPKSIEIFSPNNSKKRKPEEQLRLPLLQQKNQKAKKEKKEKVKRKRKKIQSGSKCKLSKRLETRKMPLLLRK